MPPLIQETWAMVVMIFQCDYSSPPADPLIMAAILRATPKALGGVTGYPEFLVKLLLDVHKRIYTTDNN